MKKSLSLLLAIFVLLLGLSLSSCNSKKNDKDKTDDSASNNSTTNPPNSSTDASGAISEGSKITIIYSNEEGSKETANQYSTLLSKIQTALLYGDVYYDAVYGQESSSPVKYEIIVGRSNRSISTTAYKRLSRVEVSKEEETDYLLGYGRWIVYAEGGSIAIAYDDDEHLAAASSAINALIDGYFSGGAISFEDGVLAEGVADYYSVYEKQDQEQLDQQWFRLKELLGEDITAALQNLYGIYSDGMIEWMANLWEPYTCVCTTEECTHSSTYCGGGAFYYSNSGRNTEGFLPDSESTRQILYFLENSGMLKTYKQIPDEMKAGIVRFLKSLQDPESGYFYHPQWGDTISNSRRGRDLGDCTTLLVAFGSAPTYDAPNGTKGDGILADGTPVEQAAPASRLTERLGLSSAVAVSKVVPTAAAIPAHLVDKESFEAYLKGLNIRENSYGAGNELAAQMSEIIQRDKVLKAEGKNYSLVSILINFLNENQNPDTGAWDWPMENDTRGAYHANNGVLKISMVYSNAGVLLPNYTKMVTNAVNTLLDPATPGAVVDVYNVWYTLSMVKGNIESYGGEEAKAHLAAFQEELLANAVTLIDATREKLVIFLKPDGSFSYHPKYSSSNSQSATVAVPQSEEGDVNATTICCTGTISTMFNALGLTKLRPQIYTDVDYMRFIHIIENLDKVIKDEIPPLEIEATGDENKGKGKYYEDSLHFDGRFSDLVNQGLFYSQNDIINLDRLNVGAYVGTTTVNKDKVMAYGKLIGGSPYLYINLMNGKNGNAIVFETDICLIGGSTEYSDGAVLQFWLDDANITNSEMWWNGSFALKQEETILGGEDPIQQYSVSPTMKKHLVTYQTWHNIRLEVQNSGIVGAEIRLYLDNVLINRSYVSTANTSLDHLTLRFRGDSGIDSVVLFDNMFLGSFDSIPADNTELIPDNIEIGTIDENIKNEQIRGTGVYAKDAQTYADVNLTYLSLIGKIGSQDGKITFDKAFSGHYAQIKHIKNTGEAMVFGSTTSSDPYLFFYAEGNEDENDKSLVFETDFAFMSGTAEGRSDNLVMQLYASKTEGVSYWYGLGLSIQHIDGKYYLCGTNLKLQLPVATWNTIRIEVDDTSKTGSEARIYVNNTLVSTFNTTSNSTYVPNMMIRFMSQCKDGKVYFDNTYFRAPIEPPPPTPVNPPTGTESDNISNGVLYEKAEKYEGRTHEALIADGIMAMNTNRGTGDLRTLSFSDGALHYKSRGSSWGSINFVSQTDGTGFVFETDIKLSGVVASKDRPIQFAGSSNNGSGNASVYPFNISIFPYSDKNVGGYLITIKGNTEDVAWIPEATWVNIRYEFDTTGSEAATRLLINGVAVLEATSTGAISNITGVELFTMSTSGGVGFIAGTISLDNTWCGVLTESAPTPPSGGGEGGNTPTEPETPVDPPVSSDDYYGKGVYYDKAINYTGATHASLISAGLMAENTPRGLGGKTLSFTDGAMVYAGVKSSWSAINFIKRGSGEGMVFETDIKIDGADISKNRATQFVGTSNNGTGNAGLYAFRISIYSNADGGYIIEIKDSDKQIAIPEGKWVNIRYEFETLTLGSSVKLYVNGELVIETVSSDSISNIKGVEMLHSSNNGADLGFSNGTITLDNTYCGSIFVDQGSRGEGAYKDLAAGFEGVTFDDLVTSGAITPVNASSAPASIVDVSGDNAVKVSSSGSSWARYSIKKQGTAANMVFETDMMIEDYSSSATRYFYIMPTSNLSANASLYAAYIVLMPNSDGGYDIYLNDASESKYTVTQGKWFNLRVEFDGLSMGDRFCIYVNGELLAEATLQKSISNAQGLQLQLPGRSGDNAGVVGNIYFDNTYLGDKKTEE